MPALDEFLRKVKNPSKKNAQTVFKSCRFPTKHSSNNEQHYTI